MEQASVTLAELAEMGWRSPSPPGPDGTDATSPELPEGYTAHTAEVFTSVTEEVFGQTASTGYASNTDADDYTLTTEVWLRNPETGQVLRSLAVAADDGETRRRIVPMPGLSPEWGERLAQALADVPPPLRLRPHPEPPEAA